MWPRFGIKIGNSTLCIAYTKADGKFDVIANKQGDRVSQACLLWDGISEIECGLTAKQKMATRQKQAVAHAFQLLHPQEDLKEEQIEAALKHIPCDYDAKAHTFEMQCPQQNGESDSEAMATHQISPYDVHVALFKAELELARQFHSDNEQKPIVVLSVPSYYGAGARSLLAEAAEEAGFHVAQVVSEPTAAILAYKIGESADDAEGTSTSTATTTSPADKTAKRHVLTIKSGGLYSHFALYAVEDGLYTQLDAYGPFPIGGKQFTEALVQFICEEFQRKFKLDPHESRRSLAKIRSAAANCKHILSQMPSTQVYIDSLMNGVDFNAQMSRARFESLIQPVIGNFMQTLNECVEKALQQHKDVQKIDGIVLLGATMQIPKLRSAISTKYPDAELHATMSADEVVAVGCAIQAMYVPDPLGRELEATEECIFIEDEVTIWHGNDESQKVELFKKGAMMPGKVQVNVPLAKDENANAEDANGNENVFNVRIGEQILKIQVSALTANGTAEKNDDEDDEEEENGSPAPLEMPRDATNCCLEAELESKEDATEAANTILRLRAL